LLYSLGSLTPSAAPLLPLSRVLSAQEGHAAHRRCLPCNKGESQMGGCIWHRFFHLFSRNWRESIRDARCMRRDRATRTLFDRLANHARLCSTSQSQLKGLRQAATMSLSLTLELSQGQTVLLHGALPPISTHAPLVSLRCGYFPTLAPVPARRFPAPQ
jgi:hypothetical protein